MMYVWNIVRKVIFDGWWIWSESGDVEVLIMKCCWHSSLMTYAVRKIQIHMFLDEYDKVCRSDKCNNMDVNDVLLNEKRRMSHVCVNWGDDNIFGACLDTFAADYCSSPVRCQDNRYLSSIGLKICKCLDGISWIMDNEWFIILTGKDDMCNMCDMMFCRHMLSIILIFRCLHDPWIITDRYYCHSSDK